MILMLSCLLIIHGECIAALTNNYGYEFKLIRGNGSVYRIEDVKKERDLEYPGDNKQILRQIQKMWQDYYTCLEENTYQKKKPETIRLLEGQFTEFLCDVCQRPFSDNQGLEWKYKPLFWHVNITEPQHLDLTPEMTLTKNNTLKIFKAIESLSGFYVCYQGKSPISVYILEVSKNDTIQKVNTTSSPDKKLIKLEGIEIEITYKWSPWTECSSCENLGRQMKYGSCLVSIKNGQQELSEEKKLDIVRDAEKLKSDKFLKRSESSFVNRRALEVIERFETGIPCKSQFLPKVLQESVVEYPSVKVIVRHCLEHCREEKIFMVVDKYGRVIEKANNTAGIYSTFQDLPQLASETERTSVEGEFGKDVILLCPGTLLSTAPVTWKIHNKIVFPDVVARQSNGRLTIDLVNRIHINKLRSKDTCIYSCWQKEKLVGTVHLNVEKKFKVNLNHHAVLLGMVIVVSIFLLIIVIMA